MDTEGRTFNGGSGIHSLCLDESAKYVLLGMDRMALHNLETATLLQTYAGHTAPVGCVAFNPSSDRIGSGSSNLYEHDVASGKLLRDFRLAKGGKHGRVNAVAYLTPEVVMACGTEGSVCLYDSRQQGKNTPTQCLDEPRDSLNGLAALPSGLVAAACSDGLLYHWDLRKGLVETTDVGRGRSLMDVAYALDASMAIILEDAVLRCTQALRNRRCWDLATPENPTVGHLARCCYVQNGAYVACTSDSGAMVLYPSEGDAQPRVLRMSEARNRGLGGDRLVSVDSKNGTVVCGSADGSVHTWMA